MNPEILRLYGVTTRFEISRIYKESIKITKYGFLIGREKIIMPGSYIFEVPVIQRFLKNIAPISRLGLFQVASPTPILVNYSKEKRKEYRDELSLFPNYLSNNSKETIIPCQWLPRVARVTANDIREEWHHQLQNNGFWQDVLRNRTRSFSPLTKWETIIATVPDRLDGRAFITRYVNALLPFNLDVEENTNMDLLISHAYLNSYLEEYGAFILCDTPLGLLDCRLANNWADGIIRVLPMRSFVSFFEFIGVCHLIDGRMGWLQLLELRSKPIMQWAIEALICDILFQSKLLDKAIVVSHYIQPKRARMLSGSDSISEIESRLWALYDSIQPIMTDIVNQQLSQTKPNISYSWLSKSLLRSPQKRLFKTSDLYSKYRENGKMKANTIFLVHGRNSTVVGSVRSLLRAAEMNPLDWDEVVSWTGTPSPPTLEVVKLGISTFSSYTHYTNTR